MAPQISIPVAANVLGTIGTGLAPKSNLNCNAESIKVLWCVQLLPQIWTNYRTKTTEGLPGAMLFIWAVCAVPFGAYSICQNFNIPVQIQAQCFGTFALISWAQTLIYHNHWPVWKASSLAGFFMALFGGVEAALILTLRPVYDRGVEYPMIILGVVASVLLVAGLIPPYFEIWRRRGRVVGISWIFLTIDWNGAFFSLLALAVQNTFDILGGVLYILCILMEGAIFLSHIIWLFRTRKIRAQAKAEGKTFDDIAEEYRQQDVEFKFAERKFLFSPREQTSEEDVPVEAELELGLSIGKQD